MPIKSNRTGDSSELEDLSTAGRIEQLREIRAESITICGIEDDGKELIRVWLRVPSGRDNRV